MTDLHDGVRVSGTPPLKGIRGEIETHPLSGS